MTFQRYSTRIDPSAAKDGDEGARYIPDEAIAVAVNTALAAEQPLLVVGEPGTGKTTLAASIAHQLGAPLLRFHCRSDHQANDVLYRFDSLRRFYDAQVANAKSADPKNYVTLAPLGEAISSNREAVVLIDEIDKAPRDFPNDLLAVLDTMSFPIRETDEWVHGKVRPIVVITSNSERQLPDPFLRRCVFHRLSFPDAGRLASILAAKYGSEEYVKALTERAIAKFEALRAEKGRLEKPPATGELVIWLKVLLRAGKQPDQLGKGLHEIPFLGALLKTERDLREIGEIGDGGGRGDGGKARPT